MVFLDGWVSKKNLNLQQVTDNGNTTTNDIVVNKLSANDNVSGGNLLSEYGTISGWGSNPLPLTLQGTDTDKATAVAIKLNSYNTLTTQGAKLLSVQNAGVETASIDLNGILQTGLLLANSTGTASITYTDASTGVTNAGWLEIHTADGTPYKVPIWTK